MGNFCLQGLCPKRYLPGLLQSQGLSLQGVVGETKKKKKLQILLSTKGPIAPRDKSPPKIPVKTRFPPSL